MDEHFFPSSRLGTVRHLKPESSGDVKLTPDTLVLCVHRGRETLTDMFDSKPYVIEPGFFTIEYGAAKHFKARAVVPGSRNPETSFQASFIAILGPVAPADGGMKLVGKTIDHHSEWDPFTPEECELYGVAVEAIDRDAMVAPIDAAVTLQSVRGGGNASVIPASRVKGGGKGKGKKKTELVGDGIDALKQKNKAGRNEAIDDINRELAHQDAAD